MTRMHAASDACGGATTMSAALLDRAAQTVAPARESAEMSVQSVIAGQVERARRRGDGGAAAAATRRRSVWSCAPPTSGWDLLAYLSFTVVQALVVCRQWADELVMPAWPSVVFLGSVAVMASCAARPTLWWRHRWAVNLLHGTQAADTSAWYPWYYLCLELPTPSFLGCAAQDVVAPCVTNTDRHGAQQPPDGGEPPNPTAASSTCTCATGGCHLDADQLASICLHAGRHRGST